MNDDGSSVSSDRSSGRLVLVTNDFPFGDYTDFMRTEIRALAARFDDVLVVPLFARGSLSKVPHNVRVDCSLAGTNGRFRRLLAIRWTSCWTTLVREIRWSVRHAGPRALPQTVLAVGRYSLVHRWARRQQRAPDIAYTYWLGPQTAALRAAWPDAAVVSRAHGDDLFWNRHDPPLIPMQETAVRSATAVASVSEVGSEYLRDKHPECAERISTKRLGSVGTRRCAPRSDDGSRRIISVSSLTAVKRPELLAMSLCTLARRIGSDDSTTEGSGSLSWHHFGSGPLTGSVQQVLQAHAPSNLTWRLHGQVSHDELLGRLEQGPWDVFLNVSESEGVPVSLMEAKSAGIPLVATRVGGTDELVDDDIDHLLPPEADHERVADAVRQAFTDPERSEERRARWASGWNAERNDSTFVDWLGEICTGHRPEQGPPPHSRTPPRTPSQSPEEQQE